MISSNIPNIKIGLVAASRNNFSDALAIGSRNEIASFLKKRLCTFEQIHTLVVTEEDAVKAVKEANERCCNALAVILGNFGPEIPEALIAKYFQGPIMYAAVSEDEAGTMYAARRDSYCGLLNCSYNLDIRSLTAYIPPYPIGNAREVADMILDFRSIATALTGLSNLKVITFGPRPNDFLACNAPIKPLYKLNIEIQENSELDLFLSYREHENDQRIQELLEHMRQQVGERYLPTLKKMAQYELTLRDWIENHKGASSYVCLANKCWPAFQKAYGFLPCYAHSRLAGDGIPVACETDIYGAVSEYIGNCVSEVPTAILDINNNIPNDVYDSAVKDKWSYQREEIFMGFHCGNTNEQLMETKQLKYKINRKQPFHSENGQEETRGTLEGRLKAGEVSCFRLQSSADGYLQSYIAEGEILPVDIDTYGCYAVFGIRHMKQFYRNVLIKNHFPHHTAVVYGNCSSKLFHILRYLGVERIGCNRTEQLCLEGNPFEQ